MSYMNLRFISAISLAGTAALVAFACGVISERSYAQTAAIKGETVFEQRCSGCHDLAKDSPSGIGPNLFGIVGRKAGSGSYTFSAALKNSNILWTKANLNRYIAAPTKKVPGTKMIVTLSDAKQRAALITYLNGAK